MAENSTVHESSSVMGSICDDEDLFFGPITDKERIVKERFERRMQERGILLPKLSNIVIDDSEDSIYESFSTESKYDSFDDSLYVEPNDLNPKETDLNTGEVKFNSKDVNINHEEKNAYPKEINASNFLSEQVNVNNRKQLLDKKSIAGNFCDSLEDIHSLVSSADRLSLSEEIEDINIMEISHTCEDSLMNDVYIANKNSNSNEPYDSLIQDICIPNKNSNSNEQYFDEDSLAILDHEKAFDDSLEDSNGPSISHVDSLILSKSKVSDVDPLVEMQSKDNRISKSYFETSIDVIYENSKEINNDIKDLNSPSTSESKNLFRDSLEEISELSNHNASKDEFHEKAMLENSGNLLERDLHNNVYSLKNSHETNEFIQASDTTDFGLDSYKVNPRKPSMEFLKPLDVYTMSNNLNFYETICIDDSILPPSDATFSKSPIENKDSKSKDDSQMLQNPQSTNDTICIDDSFVSSSESAYYSFPKYNCHSKYEIHNDDLGTIEVEKRHNPKPIIAPSCNDTICIEDSMIEPTDAALNSLNISRLNVAENNCVLKEKIFECDVLSNPSFGTANESVCDDSLFILACEPTLKEDKIVLNKTICIDDSIILPPEPILEKEKPYPNKSNETKKNRHSSLGKKIEKDFQKLRISDVDKMHCNNVSVANLDSPTSSGNTVIDIVVRSPLHKSPQKSIIVEHSNIKCMTKTPERVPTIVAEAERNLKLHIEVAVDKDQGVNMVSVSSVNQDSSEKYASANEVNQGMSEGGFNKSSVLKDQAKVNVSYRNKRNCGLKTSVIDSPHSSPMGTTSGINDRENVRRKRHSGYFSVNLEMHDASLLQALDLHDTSCNLSQGGPVQSRDSIMPLNLCTREKLFEKRNKIVSRNESKENIPYFIPSKKFNAKEQNIPNNQKCKGSPKSNKGTPQKKNTTKQQLNNMNEVKRSGGKINPATKIPIRKLDSTPSSQKKKPEFKPSSNSSKQIKTIFATPACPSSASQKEVPGETPKKNHHFCMVRNSISKVPKSAQKVTSKKFQNIQSPIAQYIGNHQVYPPLKATHHYDGNLFAANLEAAPQCLKTAKNTLLSANPGSIKADKKF